ncbi:hypothetical protein FRC07_006968 [Ceratobasidium sp. 392]|nr:hypothetical protein FRC07_006968 [Ceratobasidium sp. 392]
MPPRKENPKATAPLNTSKRIEAACIKHAKKTKEILAKLRAVKRLAQQQLPPEEDDAKLLVKRGEETEHKAWLRDTHFSLKFFVV